jgi:hypothetical protein
LKIVFRHQILVDSLGGKILLPFVLDDLPEGFALTVRPEARIGGFRIRSG